MKLLGIHHVTLVCSNARRTLAFYAGELGLRLVKKTVNFDDPAAYHLYIGDETGSPGTLLTFFEWKDLPHGQWGIGATHHVALVVESAGAQMKWKRRLRDHGISVTGPYDRTYFRSIYFTDPDGIILEIATRDPGWAADEPEDAIGSSLIPPPEAQLRDNRDEAAIAALTWPEPVETITEDMKLTGLHHLTAICSDIERTAAFYTGVLEMRLVKKTMNYDDPEAPHYYFGAGDGKPGTVITYFGYAHDRMRRGRLGTGLTHHFALAIENEEQQFAAREQLLAAGVEVTPILDRMYFRSVYFWDPDGHIMEIATAGPGFLIDEDRGSLGSRLCLPPWLENDREVIESSLRPIS